MTKTSSSRTTLASSPKWSNIKWNVDLNQWERRIMHLVTITRMLIEVMVVMRLTGMTDSTWPQVTTIISCTSSFGSTLVSGQKSFLPAFVSSMPTLPTSCQESQISDHASIRRSRSSKVCPRKPTWMSRNAWTRRECPSKRANQVPSRPPRSTSN